MKLLQHRVNTVQQLVGLDRSVVCGYECDIRYAKGHPYLHHDVVGSHDDLPLLSELAPFSAGLDVILNFKETGEELDTCRSFLPYCREALLLDLPFPEVVKIARAGFGSLVLWRVSEHERPCVAQLLDFQARWLWLDSFYSYWFSPSDLDSYREAGLHICLVSNELQGRSIEDGADSLNLLQQAGGYLDAVCTKYPEWYIKHSLSAPC